MSDELQSRLRQVLLDLALDPDQVDEGASIAQGLYLAGQDRWPHIPLSAEVFAEHLTGHFSIMDNARAMQRRMHTGEMFLSCACARGAPEAIAVLENEYFANLGEVFFRFGLQKDQEEEIWQDIRTRLLMGQQDRKPYIANYAGWASLRNWLRVVVMNTAISAMRKKRPELLADDQDWFDHIVAEDDPELQHFKRLYSDTFNNAMHRAVGSLSSRERNLLRLHYLGGQSTEQIASLYRVHRATAARWIVRSRQRILERTREDLAHQLDLSAEALDSLFDLVCSWLDFSLGHLLATRDDP